MFSWKLLSHESCPEERRRVMVGPTHRGFDINVFVCVCAYTFFSAFLLYKMEKNMTVYDIACALAC